MNYPALATDCRQLRWVASAKGMGYAARPRSADWPAELVRQVDARFLGSRSDLGVIHASLSRALALRVQMRTRIGMDTGLAPAAEHHHLAETHARGQRARRW